MIRKMISFGIKPMNFLVHTTATPKKLVPIQLSYLVRPYNYLLEAIYLILISREMMVVTAAVKLKALTKLAQK
jgi:hypothetical protein